MNQSQTARVSSAKYLIDQRLAGNVGQASNKAFLRAIATLSAAREPIPDEAIVLAHEIQGPAEVPEDGECDWCGVAIAQCEKYDHGEDAEGCPGPELRAMRARNLRLHAELVEHRKLLARAVLGLRSGGDTGTASEIEKALGELTKAAASLPRRAFDQVPIRSDKNAISILYEHAMRVRRGQPTFRFTQTGMAHMPTIHCECSYDGLHGEGTDNNKQQAKLLAAMRVLEMLQARRG